MRRSAVTAAVTTHSTLLLRLGRRALTAFVQLHGRRQVPYPLLHLTDLVDFNDAAPGAAYPGMPPLAVSTAARAGYFDRAVDQMAAAGKPVLNSPDQHALRRHPCLHSGIFVEERLVPNPLLRLFFPRPRRRGHLDAPRHPQPRLRPGLAAAYAPPHRSERIPDYTTIPLDNLNSPPMASAARWWTTRTDCRFHVLSFRGKAEP